MAICLIGEGKGCVPTVAPAAGGEVHCTSATGVDCITNATLKNNSGQDAQVRVWITNPGEEPDLTDPGSCNQFGCINLLAKSADCEAVECILGRNLEPGGKIWMQSDQDGVAFWLDWKKIPA